MKIIRIKLLYKAKHIYLNFKNSLNFLLIIFNKIDMNYDKLIDKSDNKLKMFDYWLYISKNLLKLKDFK